MSSFALAVVFFFLPVLKIEVLANSVRCEAVWPNPETVPKIKLKAPKSNKTTRPFQVDYALSEQLRDKNQFDIAFVSAALVGFILLSLVIVAAVAAQQIFQAARVPTIRLQGTGAQPELPLAKGHTRHMFLSQCSFASNT